MIVFGALLVGIGIGFIFGVAYGVRETLADEAERNYKRIRDSRRLVP